MKGDRSMDRDSSRHSDNLTLEEPGQGPSKFTGLVLIVPGIILYVYILYIMFSMLIYPGSFSPFMSRPSPPRIIGGNENITSGVFYHLQGFDCVSVGGTYTYCDFTS